MCWKVEEVKARRGARANGVIQKFPATRFQRLSEYDPANPSRRTLRVPLAASWLINWEPFKSNSFARGIRIASLAPFFPIFLAATRTTLLRDANRADGWRSECFTARVNSQPPLPAADSSIFRLPFLLAEASSPVSHARVLPEQSAAIQSASDSKSVLLQCMLSTPIRGSYDRSTAFHFRCRCHR